MEGERGESISARGKGQSKRDGTGFSFKKQQQKMTMKSAVTMLTINNAIESLRPCDERVIIEIV
jgi:hypothetical protein